MKDIHIRKEDIKQSCSEIKRLNTGMVSILLKWIYEFKPISTKITRLLKQNGQAIYKIISEPRNGSFHSDSQWTYTVLCVRPVLFNCFSFPSIKCWKDLSIPVISLSLHFSLLPIIFQSKSSDTSVKEPTERQPNEWEKLFIIDTFDTGWTSKIYKELI